MRFGSVCSGIEAASVAWLPLGWTPAFLSEIAPFPRAVLKHHYPDVPLRGDFTEIQAGDHADIDLLVGGTPCQGFSIAGLRGGLDDDRSVLALEYLRLAQRLRPRWLVWENVPGALSIDEGRAFGAILGGLAELGYGWAYRVLDAQFAGLAQRRERVFVVGCAGGAWQRAAAVLFESTSLRGDPPPSRKAGQDVAGPLGSGSPGGGWRSDVERMTFVPEVSLCRSAHHGRSDAETETFVAEVAGTLESTTGRSRGAGTPVPMLVPTVAGTLGANGKAAGSATMQDAMQNLLLPAVSFNARQDPDVTGDLSGPLGAKDTGHAGLHGPCPSQGVRRLTPLECETIMGFPPLYTQVPYRKKPAADGNRYHALGNSIATTVLRRIGERIDAVDSLAKGAE